ncbi:MAG: hypothetical protein IPK60_13410 [Sandaracinaceae bacterium]|nr:hypothetical protein [Sandaracinaceae bacterium]
MQHFTLFETLEALFQLTREGARVDELTIARRLGTSSILVSRSLKRLDDLGLCDAARVRLSMRGLVVAASYDTGALRAEPLRRVA